MLYCLSGRRERRVRRPLEEVREREAASPETCWTTETTSQTPPTLASTEMTTKVRRRRERKRTILQPINLEKPSKL